MHLKSPNDSDRAREIARELDCLILDSDKIDRCLGLYHQMKDVLVIGKLRDKIAMEGLHSTEFLPLVSHGISIFTMEWLKDNDRKHHRELLKQSIKITAVS